MSEKLFNIASSMQPVLQQGLGMAVQSEAEEARKRWELAQAKASRDHDISMLTARGKQAESAAQFQHDLGADERNLKAEDRKFEREQARLNSIQRQSYNLQVAADRQRTKLSSELNRWMTTLSTLQESLQQNTPQYAQALKMVEKLETEYGNVDRNLERQLAQVDPEYAKAMKAFRDGYPVEEPEPAPAPAPRLKGFDPNRPIQRNHENRNSVTGETTPGFGAVTDHPWTAGAKPRPVTALAKPPPPPATAGAPQTAEQGKLLLGHTGGGVGTMGWGATKLLLEIPQKMILKNLVQAYRDDSQSRRTVRHGRRQAPVSRQEAVAELSQYAPSVLEELGLTPDEIAEIKGSPRKKTLFPQPPVADISKSPPVL